MLETSKLKSEHWKQWIFKRMKIQSESKFRWKNLEENTAATLSGALKKQKYHLVGSHSAVKRCKWLYESIVNDRHCYKQKFYGIKSHRCIQMSPSLYYCTQQCLFCWRAQSGDLQVTWDEMKIPKVDSPEEIVEGCFKAQEKILTGYKGNPKTNWRKFQEALTPKQVAISLTGEPTLYEPLGELIQHFTKRLNHFSRFQRHISS